MWVRGLVNDLVMTGGIQDEDSGEGIQRHVDELLKFGRPDMPDSSSNFEVRWA